MKVEKPIDRRVQKTRKLLLDSLINLILEKGYEEVSIQEIIDRANVGRSTFYAHFENKEQLLFSGHDQLTQSLLQKKHKVADNSVHPSASPGEKSDFFKELYQHAADNHTLAKAMLGKGGGNLIIEKVKAILIGHFQQKAQRQHLDHKKIDLFAAAFASSVVGMLSHWLESNLPFPVDYMKEKSYKILDNFLELMK
jgi:AcrR family transcriptional regulator